MAKIDERKNQELSKIVQRIDLTLRKYRNESWMNTGTTNNSTTLEKMQEQIDAETEKAIVSLENLYQKNEANYQRKLRYNHVFSLNIHVGRFNRTELENLISVEEPNPEESLINKLDKQSKKDRLASALASLDTVD